MKSEFKAEKNSKNVRNEHFAIIFFLTQYVYENAILVYSSRLNTINWLLLIKKCVAVHVFSINFTSTFCQSNPNYFFCQNSQHEIHLVLDSLSISASKKSYYKYCEFWQLKKINVISLQIIHRVF